MSSHSAREKILARLRAAKPELVPLPDVGAYYATRTHEDLETRVERLALNLKNAMAEVHRTTVGTLAADLSALVREKGFGMVAIGPEVVTDSGLSTVLGKICTLLPVITPRNDEPALFNQVDAGLTLSHAAIAETGTIVLWCGPQSPRLLSLVPPVHIAVVDTRRTYDSLFDLMRHEHWAQGLPTNVVLVSSPSKTADIQQTLAYGAHGPKQLIVMLVEDH